MKPAPLTKWRCRFCNNPHENSLTATAAGRALAATSSGTQLFKSKVALTCGLAIDGGQAERGGMKSARNTSSQGETLSEMYPCVPGPRPQS